MKKFINKIMSCGVIAGLLLETFPVWAITKEESIYAKLNANGQVDKVIVSEHLKINGEKEIQDKTKLENIQNVGGNEKYTLDNGKLAWESNGKDIYYQGSTKEELPISLKVTYYFNDKESNIKDMLGKKGSVKIVLKYINNDKHSVKVNGKYETLFTPFVVATTTIIPNINNSNIKVTNGKVVANGTNSVVVTLSTPGLYESLNIEKLKGMDTVEISYDTESFELSSIYSISTPKLIDSADMEIFDNIDKLYNSINTLVSSSNQLKSGSNKLLQGASQLKDGVYQLKDGINSIYNGSLTIENTLSSSMNNLKNDNTPAIDNNTLVYIENSAEQKAIEEVEKLFTNEYKYAIATQAIQALNSKQEYATMKSNITKFQQMGINDNLVTECSKETIDESYLEICSKNATYIGQYNILVQVTHAMEETAKETAIYTAYTTAKQTAAKTAKDTSTEVAKQIATSAKEKAKETTLQSLGTLLTGIKQLSDGLNLINTKMNDLDNGAQELKNGISQLDSGIAQFNSQGINKISNIVNGDVKSIEGKIKALVQLSNNYKTFDENGENTEGSTKIIMVINQVKKASEVVIKNEKIEGDKKSLWDKIKGLFN